MFYLLGRQTDMTLTNGTDTHALVDDVKDSHSDRQTGQLARDYSDLFFPVWSGAEAQQSVRVISLHPSHPSGPLPTLT